jgi:hypothetical protein
MSRLDRHVAAVQNKLMLGRMLEGLAWAGLVFVALVWLAILINRLFQFALPRQEVWFWAGLAAAIVAAMVYAFVRRPDRHRAAVLIDQRLGLKEKFSTALYARPLADPFAQAAVTDAERTADSVDLGRRFPLAFPRPAFATIAIALVAFFTSFMQPQDLFGREQRAARQLEEQRQVEQAREVVREAIAQVQAIPRAAIDQESVSLALKQLEELLQQPSPDPQQTRRTATKALQDVENAIRDKINESSKFATAQNDARIFRSLQPPMDDKTPVAEAHRAISRGDFETAVNEIQKAVENFDKMDEQDQQKAAEQMAAMAQQLADLANNPAAQQQMQQQLQRLGMDQQQAQQMAQQIQQAAGGDQQAQQQVQQQVQQMMAQMNNGQGPNAQQQQQIQQMMNQMQAQANTQAQAQAMAQAAQQMAQAMQQQAGQQGNPQQGQAGQQMAQGMQGMQQQLQQMQAMQQDAAAVAAAQAAAAAAAQAAAGGLQPGEQQAGAQGQWGENCPDCGGAGCEGGACKGQGQGLGQGGEGFAGQRDRAFAPGAFKQEVSPSQDNEEGRILAAWFVKDQSVKGESRVELQQVIAAAEAEATDEVDQERIGLQSQRIVREYFKSMQRDLE